MVDTLVGRTCTPCQGGIPPLTPQEAEGLHAQVPQWDVRDEALRIERTFRFRNFREALTFVQQVGELAETEGASPRHQLWVGLRYGDLANQKDQRSARERLHCCREDRPPVRSSEALVVVAVDRPVSPRRKEMDREVRRQET